MSTAPTDPGTPSNLSILSTDECYELLAVATVGRIGFSSSNGIDILPVVYRLGADRSLFVRTSPHGSVARLAESDTEVAFEVDHHASDFGIAWSVLMNGTLGLLDAAATAAYEDLRRPPVPWPGLANTVPVRFLPRTISGRGLHRP